MTADDSRDAHRWALDRLRQQFDQLRARRDAPAGNFFAQVGDVILVGSSSRGGSSVFTEMLRHSDALLHFQAEINPFLALAGLTYPFSGTGSDALGSEHAAQIGDLGHYFAGDVGRRTDRLADADACERFALQLWWRLCLQWPEIEFALDDVRSWMQTTLDELIVAHGWRPGRFDDAALFHIIFLRHVRAAHPKVNPYYYDLDPTAVRLHCPDIPVPVGPPGEVVVEEPPFVTIGPWLEATAEELERHPLVVKTPSNAYRMPFLRRLFADDRVRLLHLVRHPGAATNGLVDGWRHRGFFSHDVATDRVLAIRGYSDRWPQWARRWWNFDLPPDWRAWTELSSSEVCARQWWSAHRALLADMRATNPSPRGYRRVRFEDAVGETRPRSTCFAAVTAWLGIDLDGALAAVVEQGLPPVMATSPPRLRRWYDNADLVAPALRIPDIRDLTLELGYAPDEIRSVT